MSHHATTGVAAYAVDPAATDGSFHLLYDGTTGVALSDEPQLLAVNLVRSNGSPVLIGHHFVDILPQPDFISGQKHIVASGCQVLPLTGVADFDPGELVGVADAPLLRVPQGALQHTTHAAGPHAGQTADSQVSAVAPSPDTEVAAPTVPSPSPALMGRLNLAKCSAFLCVWARLPPHLREIAFNLHDPGWDPPAIEQLGDMLCDFPDVCSTSKTDLGSCSLMLFDFSVPEGGAPFISRSHRKPYTGQRSGRDP